MGLGGDLVISFGGGGGGGGSVLVIGFGGGDLVIGFGGGGSGLVIFFLRGFILSPGHLNLIWSSSGENRRVCKLSGVATEGQN